MKGLHAHIHSALLACAVLVVVALVDGAMDMADGHPLKTVVYLVVFLVVYLLARLFHCKAG